MFRRDKHNFLHLILSSALIVFSNFLIVLEGKHFVAKIVNETDDDRFLCNILSKNKDNNFKNPTPEMKITHTFSEKEETSFF